jgi:hypothetical protein
MQGFYAGLVSVNIETPYHPITIKCDCRSEVAHCIHPAEEAQSATTGCPVGTVLDFTALLALIACTYPRSTAQEEDAAGWTGRVVSNLFSPVLTPVLSFFGTPGKFGTCMHVMIITDMRHV